MQNDFRFDVTFFKVLYRVSYIIIWWLLGRKMLHTMQDKENTIIIPLIPKKECIFRVIPVKIHSEMLFKMMICWNWKNVHKCTSGGSSHLSCNSNEAKSPTANWYDPQQVVINIRFPSLVKINRKCSVLKSYQKYFANSICISLFPWYSNRAWWYKKVHLNSKSSTINVNFKSIKTS